MLNRVLYVPWVPAWSTCQRGNMANVCQLLIFMCQPASKCPNVPKVCQLFNLTCQCAKSVPIFQFRLPKGVPIFQLFSNYFFCCSLFANFNKVWTILENLSRETNNLNFDICKISLRKSLANLKPLTTFSMEHVGLTEQLFG